MNALALAATQSPKVHLTSQTRIIAAILAIAGLATLKLR